MLRGFESLPLDEEKDSRATIHLVIPEEASGVLPFSELGDYELLAEIGRGGMGIIYQARQRSLDRIIALKLIRAGALAKADGVARFKLEAAATARLRHPGIVTVHEVGEHQGQHYYSMDFVAGRSLAATLRDGPLAARGAAECVRTVAEAIQYAHQQGVIHRDLKPSNILLDAEGGPHVADFGLAKLLQSDSELTLTGAVLGSPNYMPPEQARGRHAEVSVRSDVYALGAILYECLTGRPPFSAATSLETMKLVVEQEPVSPRVLNPILPRDLETVCLKCLAKEPAGRYATSQELADELGRFLCGEPIRARPNTFLERSWKWARRHPARAALIAVVTVAPVLIITALLVMGSKVTRERNLAREHEHNAQTAAARAKAESQQAAAARAETRQNLYAADMLLAQHALDDGNLGLARRLIMAYAPRFVVPALAGSRPGTPAPPAPAEAGTTNQVDLRGFEWRYLRQQVQGDQFRTLRGHSNSVTCVAFSPDGRTLVSCGEDLSIKLWAVDSGEVIASWKYGGEFVHCVSFSPDGQYLATGQEGGVVQLWNITRGKAVWTLKGQTPVRAVFAGSFLAVYQTDPLGGRAATRAFKLFDWATHQEVRICSEFGTLESATRDGKILATGFFRAGISGIDLWDVASGEKLRTVNNVVLFFLALSHNGQMIAACRPGAREVQLCDATGVRPMTLLQGHTGTISAMEFSPDGTLLATASADQSLRLWDVATYREVARLRGHESYVNGLAFSPDGNFIATAGQDHTVRFWRVENKPSVSGITRAYPPFILSPDGKMLAAGTAENDRITNKQVLVCDLTREDSEVLLTAGFTKPVFFSTNGQSLATLKKNADGLALTFWNLADKTSTATIPLLGSRSLGDSIAVSTDRQLLVANDADTLWSTTTGQRLGSFPPPRSRREPKAYELALSPDGRTLAAACYDWHKAQLLVFWDVVSRTERMQQDLAGVQASSLHFSPDSQLLATGMRDQTIRLWETATGRECATLAGHRNGLGSAPFSPDGRTLDSVTGDEMKLWNVFSRREVANWRNDQVILRFCAFADGQSLVMVDWPGAVRILRAPTLAEIDAKR